MATKSTKKEGNSFTSSPASTTIRIDKSTKEKIENLDFVRKHTFDEILNELMEFYEKNKKEVKK